jgi:DNA-binding LacI/PurR family transcriptional regulator
MALFGAGEAYGDLPLMTPSYSKATAALAAHLSDLGHARVAIVADEERSDALIAIGDALAAGSIEVDWIEPSEAGGMGDLVGGLMARASRPTAVIVRDATSWGLLAACADARLHIPNDFSLISVGELADDARRAEHGVSALVIDPNHIGRAAARAMLTWLAGSRPAPRVPVQAAIWEPRATTGPALRLVWRAEA